MKKMRDAKIYTDGSCLGNPGPGGWAAVVVHNDKIHTLTGGEEMTTNNRMELLAVIKALESLYGPHNVTIYSDSQYIVNGINKGWLDSWKRNQWHTASGGEVKNPDLWQQLDQLIQKHTCTFQWVRGHAGNRYNEECDRLAVQRAQEYRDGLYRNEIADNPDADKAVPAQYSEDEIKSALDHLITSLNTAKYDGLERPCGAHECCMYCLDAENSETPCADAYLEAYMRQERRTAERRDFE